MAEKVNTGIRWILNGESIIIIFDEFLGYNWHLLYLVHYINGKFDVCVHDVYSMVIKVVGKFIDDLHMFQWTLYIKSKIDLFYFFHRIFERRAFH